MKKELFSDSYKGNPKIYAYSDSHPQYEGLLKIGYTSRKTVQERVKEQYPILSPGEKTYTIHLDVKAIRNDGSSFIDKDVHKILERKGFSNPKGEWFRCTVEDVKTAVNNLVNGDSEISERIKSFPLRPEQKEAIKKTKSYILEFEKENPGKTSHFLWNAKMRFGKTFAAYKLALELKWKKILVLTFQPAVQSAWQEDLLTHVDFPDWQFISRDGLSFSEANKDKPFVCFGSFQDFLGKNSVGGIKPKNEWVHRVNWDCVIFDEYHFGAWREKAKELFQDDEVEETNFLIKSNSYFKEEFMPISTKFYLYLSGTPFRAISTGEFIEEQIFNWTYADEQEAKNKWVGEDNPYSSLPRMILMTYKVPDYISTIANEGEFNEFDLNKFFEAKQEYDEAEFVYKNEVQQWLNFIRGQNVEDIKNNLKLREKKPPFPYSDNKLMALINHSLWYLPNVSACYAMKNLLLERHNKFFHDYKIIVAAGERAGTGLKALLPVRNAMDNPLDTKTITLSCRKLTTGVTVKPWSAIFMLRNLSTPESYFQAAFRVQSPWEIANLDGESPNRIDILKHNCYVFDFAPNRALTQISDYSCNLNYKESDPEKKVDDFIKFLPVLAYDGTSMQQIDATSILDVSISGTSATLLARRWESALLVNVDNLTLERLLKNEDAMKALESIEGFRNLNDDIVSIINKSESIKKLKTKANNEKLSKKERKQLTEDEKDFINKRKKIQKQLIKFATRIPIFMYLTDFREKSLIDVITQLEPSLFKKVTGLTLKDFDLLISLNVFNSALMNDAIYNFKRYEDSSLGYIGINKNKSSVIGLFDTVTSKEEFENRF